MDTENIQRAINRALAESRSEFVQLLDGYNLRRFNLFTLFGLALSNCGRGNLSGFTSLGLARGSVGWILDSPMFIATTPSSAGGTPVSTTGAGGAGGA